MKQQLKNSNSVGLATAAGSFSGLPTEPLPSLGSVGGSSSATHGSSSAKYGSSSGYSLNKYIVNAIEQYSLDVQLSALSEMMSRLKIIQANAHDRGKGL